MKYDATREEINEELKKHRKDFEDINDYHTRKNAARYIHFSKVKAEKNKKAAI